MADGDENRRDLEREKYGEKERKREKSEDNEI